MNHVPKRPKPTLEQLRDNLRGVQWGTFKNKSSMRFNKVTYSCLVGNHMGKMTVAITAYGVFVAMITLTGWLAHPARKPLSHSKRNKIPIADGIRPMNLFQNFYDTLIIKDDDHETPGPS